jgi:hypothetical protein
MTFSLQRCGSIEKQSGRHRSGPACTARTLKIKRGGKADRSHDGSGRGP